MIIIILEITQKLFNINIATWNTTPTIYTWSRITENIKMKDKRLTDGGKFYD